MPFSYSFSSSACVELTHAVSPPPNTPFCCQVGVSYFGTFEEESIKDQFTTCYSIMDEMLDFGFPQTTVRPCRPCVSNPEPDLMGVDSAVWFAGDR